ncbi:TfoX/Sxy family protein [Rhodoferax sp.]|uniref:TfoX/Sxy family protein n=1 Tax=Rhodoferax sp. TaxID=50421 RepID=UPI00374DDCF0
MSAGSSSFVDFILEQLAGMPQLRSKRFFGGIGLVSGETQFAMLMGNTLYFVVNDITRPRYEQIGSQCFAYDTKARRVQVKKYFEVPADMLEDPSALLALAQEALQTARQAKLPKPKSRV